jgi:hypothetical protein
MKDPLSSRPVQIWSSGWFRPVSSSPSASVDLPWFDPVPDHAMRRSAPPPLSPRRREIGADSLPPVLRAGADGRKRSCIYPGSIPAGLSQVTKFARRHHSPYRRSRERSRPPGHGSGSSWQSSRPPRPAQRISRCPSLLGPPTSNRPDPWPLDLARRRGVGVPVRLAALQQGHHHPQQPPGHGHDRLLAAGAVAQLVEDPLPAAGVPH